MASKKKATKKSKAALKSKKKVKVTKPIKKKVTRRVATKPVVKPVVKKLSKPKKPKLCVEGTKSGRTSSAQVNKSNAPKRAFPSTRQDTLTVMAGKVTPEAAKEAAIDAQAEALTKLDREQVGDHDHVVDSMPKEDRA